MPYLYQEEPRYFAQVAHNMEELGVREVEALGGRNVEAVYRGVHFDANPATLYRITYRSRLLTRILAPLVRFMCHNPDYLYRKALEIDWTDFLQPYHTLAVFANVSNSKIRHSKYIALRLKDAIVDQFRDAFDDRPNIDTREPDLWLNVYIENNLATISAEVSGGSLHRRGYRTHSVEAPMQETVAAAILEMAEWDGETPLYDPMCGSGTILAEALMRYTRTPAGILRDHFGFMQLPDFDAAAWERVRREAAALHRPLPDGWIRGSDISSDNLKAARMNLRQLPGGDEVELKEADFQELPGFENTTIVCNPPYGLRLRRGENLDAFYKSLGDFLKQNCTGSNAYIYFGEREYLKRIGLRASWKKPLVNGKLDGRLAKFELY